MSDWLQTATGTAPGRLLSKRLGIPSPPSLRRYEPGQPLLEAPALVGGAPGGRLHKAAADILVAAGAEVKARQSDGQRYGAVVYDASGSRKVADLARLHAFVAPAFKALGGSGRLIILGTPPEAARDPEEAAVQKALDGFVRSAGKEARFGTTANLLYVGAGAEDAFESALRFFASARSAYVDGQVIRVNPAPTPGTPDWEQPLKGRVAVVTGAARGIGEAIATVLARDGAEVICADVPAAGAALAEVANRIGGTAFQVDITEAEAPRRFAAHLLERHGGAHVVVHNAGITIDRLLVNLKPEQWAKVLAVNLDAQIRINRELLHRKALGDAARIVCISSTSGIAGNRGQTNYAASKAGIIGMVQAWAPELAKLGSTINAVAPGFIETAMTARMPLATRELGRRVNSLQQGGRPVDVAETVAWLGQPGSASVNGQLVRVCGQSMLGA